jgi:arylsulfatase A-like enzyme
MRFLVSLLAAFCAINPAAAQPSRSQPGSSPPNILFLISDDHSQSGMGCYGNPVVQTPNLDRLSREGMRFTSAFVISPQCSPSRSSIFTGQAPHTTGTSRLAAPLRAHHTNVVDLLKGAGYHTGAYGKVHLGKEFESKFDFRAGPGGKFAQFFETRPKGKPFFLWVGFIDPHRDYEKGAFSPPHDPAKVAVPAFLPDTPEVREDLALYYDEIARMDKESGEVLALLEKEKLGENTLVVFAADNGMPFPGAKGSLYEAGIKVPLIARWPGKIPAGRASDEILSLMDLAPTWLEAAGLPVPPSLQGKSFLNVLLGKPNQGREMIFSERNFHDNLDLVRCVRTRQYKLIQNYRPELPYNPTADLARSPTWGTILALNKAGKLDSKLQERYFRAPRPTVELYDLEKDPGEFTNLAGDPAHAATLRRLQGHLRTWMDETNDFLPLPRPEGTPRNRPAGRRAEAETAGEINAE